MSNYEYDEYVHEVRNAPFFGMTVDLYWYEPENTKEEVDVRRAEQVKEGSRELLRWMLLRREK